MTTTAPTHRSFSQVRQLRTCGWQYHLERIVKIPGRPSVPALAGVAVHVATEEIDRLLLSGQTDAPHINSHAQAQADASLNEAIAKQAEAGWEPTSFKYFGRQDLEWFRTIGIPYSVEAYTEWRLSNPSWVLAEVPGFGPAIEVPFNWYHGSLHVHGFIDRIFAVNGELVPLDIKSGRKPKTTEQLGLYAAALRDAPALGWEIQTGYFLYDLKGGNAKLTQPLDLTVWSPDALGRLYGTASTIIEQGLFIPNPGEACWLACSVSHACEFAQAVV